MKILIWVLLITVIHNSLVRELLSAVNKEAYDWIGVPEDKFEQALTQSKLQMEPSPTLIQQLLSSLQRLNSSMTVQSLDMINKFTKQQSNIVEGVRTFLNYSIHKIEFLEEKNKLKHAKRFVQEYAKYCEKVFDSRNTVEFKGKAIGGFVKGLLEYYYVKVLSESETLSTVLMRAFTVRTPILQHKDLSFCLDIQTIGQLCDLLENMDINTIFVKIPKIVYTMRHLKLKEKCRNEGNYRVIRELSTVLGSFDMFRHMYQNYEPYVDIATQKYGITKVKMLARNIAQLVQNSTEIAHYQRTTKSPLSTSTQL